jgi:Flp pilus assembly protein TadG
MQRLIDNHADRDPAQPLSLMHWLSLDTAGATAVEFALIMPLFLLVLVGSLDLGQMVYAKAVLDGVVEKAARDSTLETGDTSLADGIVRETIAPILPDSRVTATRKSYFDYANSNRGEELITDANGDGNASQGDKFIDLNNNDRRDKDLGVDGNGGSNDVIVYTVNVEYEPIFAMPLVPLDWSTRNISATAVKRNQPFAKVNGSYSAREITCSQSTCEN